jgi:hypothetical protein
MRMRLIFVLLCKRVQEFFSGSQLCLYACPLWRELTFLNILQSASIISDWCLQDVKIIVIWSVNYMYPCWRLWLLHDSITCMKLLQLWGYGYGLSRASQTAKFARGYIPISWQLKMPLVAFQLLECQRSNSYKSSCRNCANNNLGLQAAAAQRTDYLCKHWFI